MIHSAGGNSLKSCVVLFEDEWWLLELGVVFKGFGLFLACCCCHMLGVGMGFKNKIKVKQCSNVPSPNGH